MKHALQATAQRMAALAAMAGHIRILNRGGADLEELRETRRALVAQATNWRNQSKATLGRAEAAGRDLTADEARRVDDLSARTESALAELTALDREIEAAENEAHLSTPQPRVSAPNIIGGRTPGARPASARIVAGSAPRTFNGMFGAQAPDAGYGGRFDSLGEFASAVLAGNDSRLIVNATMTETTGADGGFAVPTQFLGPVLDAALQMEVVRPMANTIPMNSKSAVASTFDYSDGTSNKRGGLQLLFGAEAQAMTEQKGRLREITLDAKKGHIFVRVSSELIADAPNFDRQLGQAMVGAVAAGLDYYFINGTGAGQPLGILNAPNLITVAEEGSQAANTLLMQNLVKMVGRLSPASYARSIWLAHPTLVPVLYLMSYTVQNVAGTENVGGTAAQAITIDAEGNLRIFGRPVKVTDACSALSSAGDLILADLSKYAVGLRADATIKRDESRYFDSDEIAFRLTLRVDGQPQDAAATKLRDGSNTVGPFVALGART